MDQPKSDAQAGQSRTKLLDIGYHPDAIAASGLPEETPAKSYQLRPGEKPKKYVEPKTWPEPHEVHGLVAAWKLRTWRLTDHNLGQIPGVKGNLTVIATDGNLGVFLTQDGTPYLGHIERKEGGVVLQQGFDGKVVALGTAARRESKKSAKTVEKEEKKSKKATIKARIKSELEDL